MALREWVYADESGIVDGDKVCVIAGYRASDAKWKRFNKDWRAVLAKPEYRRVEVFHAKVFFNRKYIKDADRNPYFAWSDDKADRFLNELLGVITRHKIDPVCVAVDVHAFTSYTYLERCILAGYLPDKSRRQHRRPQPYHLCITNFVQDALRDVPPGTELHFVIAEQKELQQRAMSVYQRMKALWEESDEEPEHSSAKQLKEMEPKKPEDYPALQAADLFANRVFNNLEHGRRLNAYAQKVLRQLARRRDAMQNVGVEVMERQLRIAAPNPDLRKRLRAYHEPSRALEILREGVRRLPDSAIQ